MIEQAWNYKSVVAKDSNNTGGSGSGSGDYIDTYQYYRIDNEINDGFLMINTLPFIVLAKGIFDVSNSPIYGTKIIGPMSHVGAAMAEQIMCYSGKSIVGDKEINEGDWKKNASEYMFTFSGPFEEDGVSIQTPEDVLKHLDYLVPITKEEFFNLDNYNAQEE